MAVSKKTGPNWDFDFEKYFAEMKIPGMDASAFLEAQRRNMEAMTAANQTAMEGMQTVAKRQADLLRQMAEDMNTLSANMMTPSEPQAQVAKQAEVTKKQFEKSLSNMKEMAELISKSQAEVANIITGRISEALDEVRTAAEKKG